MLEQGKEHKLQTIISDLQVLSDKCSRDVNDKQGLNSERYREEYNRILEEAKKSPTRLYRRHDFYP